jgi:hypothetical protein
MLGTSLCYELMSVPIAQPPLFGMEYYAIWIRLLRVLFGQDRHLLHILILLGQWTCLELGLISVTVKFLGLLCELIAGIVLVATGSSGKLVIVLTVLVFVFGTIECCLSAWRHIE